MLDQSIADLEFEHVRTRLVDFASTDVAKESIATASPYKGVKRVKQELDLTSEVRCLLESGAAPPFGGISNIQPLLDHSAKQRILDIDELLSIADTTRGIWLLQQYFRDKQSEAPLTAEVASVLPELDDLHVTLHDTFDAHRQICDDATKELQALRKTCRSLHETIRKRIHAMLGDDVIQEHLQDSYYTLRDDRYVLPVVASDKRDVAGIIHGSSQTGQTLFIEPAELVPINNKLKLCEQAVTQEEVRILKNLTAHVGDYKESIETSLQTVATLDHITARARLSMAMSAYAPEVTAESKFNLKNARNPILVLRDVNVVPNDIEFGESCRLLILTGPNAGGKTVTLNTVGLFATMVRYGLHITADPDSTIGVFEHIFTVVGDQQDIQSDLSTFSGHLVRLKMVLDQLTSQSLVLIDEVIVGTEPEQGSALAIAVLENIVDRGAVGIVTTHYKRLKMLSLSDQRFENASVGFDDRTHTPTYQLNMGIPGASSPIDLASRMGLHPQIIDRAEAIVGGQSQDIERTLKKLEATQTQLDKERAQLRHLRHQTERTQKKHKDALVEIELNAEKMVREAQAAALDDIADAREELASIVRELQKDPTHAKVHKRRSRVRELEERLNQDAPTTQPDDSDKQPALLPKDEIRVGTRVFVPAFDCDGEIIELRGNNAVVRVGKMHSTVKAAQLRRPRSGPTPVKTRKVVAEVKDIEAPPRTPANTVDVRGERFDTALDQVERFLDNALLSAESVIYVLHGHGTNRLKNGIRDYLKTSHYVERHEPAEPHKGGDGVTVVWLK